MLSAVASLPLLIPRICGLILVHYCSCSNCLADMCHVYMQTVDYLQVASLETVIFAILGRSVARLCSWLDCSNAMHLQLVDLCKNCCVLWFIKLSQWSTCLLGVNLTCISFHERLYHALVYYLLYYIQQCMYQHDNSTYHYSVTVHKQMHELCHRSLDQSSSPFGCCVKWRRL